MNANEYIEEKNGVSKDFVPLYKPKETIYPQRAGVLKVKLGEEYIDISRFNKIELDRAKDVLSLLKDRIG